MTPEQLKVIAEGMGYHFDCINDGVVLVSTNVNLWEYNPITNNDQCMEIMEKLHTWVTWPFHKHSCEILISKEGKSYIGKGKTINEAVCNAAYEYFKEDV